MAVVIFDVALYSRTQLKKIYLCPWRKILASNESLEWKDLNYGTVNDLAPVLEPLNTWIEKTDPPFTEESFPFLVYRRADSSVNGGNPFLVIHRDLESLENDKELLEYKC